MQPAAGLVHWITTSGRTMPTSIGTPLRALTMPPTSQPPSRYVRDAVPRSQRLALAERQIINALTLKVWRTSKLLRPRSASKLSSCADVRASFEPAVLPRLLPKVYCAFIVRPVREPA